MAENLPTNSPSKSDRANNSFGLVRLILAALVVFCHSQYLPGWSLGSFWNPAASFSGWIAVQGFFGMSGMFIAQSWVRTPNALVFGWHRTLRLVPALWAQLLFVVLLAAPLAAALDGGVSAFAAVWRDSATYALHNAFNPGADPVISAIFSHSSASPYVNGSLWTLRYEVVCYVLAGVTGILGLWRGRAAWTRWAWLLSALILALDRPPFGGAIVFTSAGKQLLPTFLGGMAWSTLSDAQRQKFSRWPVVLALGSAIAAGYHLGWGAKVSALLVPPFVVGLGYCLPGRNMERRLGGDYSYGLYVGAYPLQQLLLVMGARGVGFLGFFLLSMLVAGSYAVMSWHLVEGPALRLKDRRPWEALRLQSGLPRR